MFTCWNSFFDSENSLLNWTYDAQKESSVIIRWFEWGDKISILKNRAAESSDQQIPSISKNNLVHIRLFIDMGTLFRCWGGGDKKSKGILSIKSNSTFIILIFTEIWWQLLLWEKRPSKTKRSLHSISSSVLPTPRQIYLLLYRRFRVGKHTLSLTDPKRLFLPSTIFSFSVNRRLYALAVVANNWRCWDNCDWMLQKFTFYFSGNSCPHVLDGRSANLDDRRVFSRRRFIASVANLITMAGNVKINLQFSCGKPNRKFPVRQFQFHATWHL